MQVSFVCRANRFEVIGVDPTIRMIANFPVTALSSAEFEAGFKFILHTNLAEKFDTPFGCFKE